MYFFSIPAIKYPNTVEASAIIPSQTRGEISSFKNT